MDDIITSITNDDIAQLGSMLDADRKIAVRTVEKEILLVSGIFHWIYVGDTALHVAAAGYRVRSAELLLSAGADPNAAANRRNSTPLHYASDGFITGPAFDPKSQLATLRLLLDAGAEVNTPDKNGATALHRATRTRCADAVRLLLSSGADPTIRNKPGSTPFHLAVQTTGRGGSGEPAAREAQRRIIEEFVEHGVSPELTDGKGHTVIECSRSEWIREIFRVNK